MEGGVLQENQQTEPIFELAAECETLFTDKITSFNDAGDENAAKLLSDLYQRFSAWAAFLGVFAESNVCLDRRLRRHADIQDQVLRLLDIMQRNLNDLSNDGDPMLETALGGTATLDEDHKSSRPTPLRLENFKAVSAAIERLNQLGTAIRRSSMTKQTSKARELAETFDLAYFEQVAYMSLKTLYPDCSESLVEQLTRSMIETYALYLHRKARKARLEVNRPRPRARPALREISEEQPDNGDSQNIAAVNLTPSPENAGVESAITQLTANRPAYTVLHSEPTSISTKEVNARLKRRLSPSVRSKPVSILVNHTSYPRPKKDSLLCEWCFGPLMLNSLEGLKWQQHINEDFRPYLCVSEKCSHRLIRFASSTEWFQHTVSEHGDSWHREVHAPSSWICPLCTEQNANLLTPEALSDHLHSDHDGIFNTQQVKAIVRQSKFPFPRQDSTCPLCCLPVSDDQNASAGNQASSDMKLSDETLSLPQPGDSRSKRIRINPGHSLFSGNRTSAWTIASHMCSHLQYIMLFTLRLISIDGPMDAASEGQGAPTDTDYQGSWISSGPRDFQTDMSAEIRDAFEDEFNHEQDLDYSKTPDEIIPDSEYIDWIGIPRANEDVFEDDPNDIRGPDSMPFSDEHASEARERLQARHGIIKEIVDSGDTFRRSMALSPDSIETFSRDHNLRNYIVDINRNLVSMRKFSLDFEHCIRDAARRVYEPHDSQDTGSAEGFQVLPKTYKRGSSQDSQSDLAGEHELRVGGYKLPGASSTMDLENDRSTLIGIAILSLTTEMGDIYGSYLVNYSVVHEALWVLSQPEHAGPWHRIPGPTKSAETDLRVFLDKPMHRVLDLLPLLEALLRYTTTDHPDRESLSTALKHMTSMATRIKGVILRQHVVTGVLRMPTPPEVEIAVESLRSGNYRETGNLDRSFAVLVGGFSTRILQLGTLKTELSGYESSVESSLDSLLQLVTAIEGFITTPSAGDIQREERWEALKHAVNEIYKETLRGHLEMVQRHVTAPLEELLSLYNKFSLSIAYRDYRIGYYQEYIDSIKRAFRENIPQEVREFMALDATLRYELPKVYSLSDTLVRDCLTRLVQLQKDWFDALQTKINSAFGERTKTLAQIEDYFRGPQRPESNVLGLGILNGSLLDKIDLLESLPPPGGSRVSQVISKITGAARSPSPPDATKEETDSAPDIATGGLFYVVSTDSLTDTFGGVTVDGYPYHTYEVGETFCVIGTHGDHYIAQRVAVNRVVNLHGDYYFPHKVTIFGEEEPPGLIYSGHFRRRGGN
ncbi:hypothetical protein BDV12DRAFT_202760 [Aspergillus spectabilis]